MTKPVVMVDVRKIADSGIGTYIRNVVPRVIPLMPEVSFQLLGKTDTAGPFFDGVHGDFKLLESDAAPLSIEEQLRFPAIISPKIDLYWATHFNVPLTFNGKMLVTVHDIMPTAMRHLSGGFKHDVYVRLMLAAIRQRAEKVITVSKFTASELERLGRIPRSKMTTIYEGVDASWSKIERRASPRPKPYLLYVGLVKPHKNLLGLMKAFEKLTENLPHDLVVVGDRDKIVTRDEESVRFSAKLGDRVVFTGRVSDDALEQYMANAAALVFPSFYEGFGLPPLEAMACGCPVVSSNAASMPEVCGDAALYFDPGNVDDMAAQIQRCVADESLRTQMILKGKLRAASFSWDSCAGQTADLISECLPPRLPS